MDELDKEIVAEVHKLEEYLKKFLINYDVAHNKAIELDALFRCNNILKQATWNLLPPSGDPPRRRKKQHP